MAVIPILLAFLACSCTCLALGMSALRWLKIELSKAECACLGYIVGAGIASCLTLAIALSHLVYRDVFYAIGLLAVVLLVRQWNWFRSLPPAPSTSVSLPFRLILAAIAIYFGVVYFRDALAPEISPDAVAYHLGEVNLWLHAHGMIRLDDMYATLSQGMEMLFLFAFAIGRHSAAALMHLSFLFVLPVLIVLYGLRFGLSSYAMIFTAVVFFTTPLIAWDGTVAYNDVALAAVAFATVYLFELWRRERQAGLLLLAAFLAGFAVAIKFTGGFIAVWLVAMTAWELRWKREAILKTVALAGLVSLIAPAPYLLRNWIWYRDPFGFFASATFRNPNFHVSFERQYIHDQMNVGGVRWRDLPRELTLGGPHLPDSFGPIYMLVPLALIGFAWPKTRALLIPAMFLVLAYPGNKAPRFLIPAVSFLFGATAYVISRIRAGDFILSRLTILQAVLCLPMVAEVFATPAGYHFQHVTWHAVLRHEPEDMWLTYHLQPYLMARKVDQLVPAGEPVFALWGGVAQAYTNHFVLDFYRSGNTERNFLMFYDNSSSQNDSVRRWTVVFPPAAVRGLRVFQTSTSSDNWSINEIRLWSHGQPVPIPADAWAGSYPYPWDAHFAIDGNGATSWKSWEAIRPGMWFDLHFNVPRNIDRVDLLSHDGQWHSQMKLQIQTAVGPGPEIAGNWFSDPPVDDRRNTTAELKREGVRYVVIDRKAIWPERFIDNSSAWGMHEIASTAFSVLYRID